MLQARRRFRCEVSETKRPVIETTIGPGEKWSFLRTPRAGVAPPPDGTLRVAGAPQKLLPAPPPPPEALLDGFESDEAVEDSRAGGWGRGFL